MPYLLHLDASARSRSFSRCLGARFAGRRRQRHPDGDCRYRDLTAEPVPLISHGWTEICDGLLRRSNTDPARYADVVDTDDQRAAWAVCAPLLDERLTADPAAS
jgi:FMN-dependent NADH-azoreductase